VRVRVRVRKELVVELKGKEIELVRRMTE